MSDAQVNNTDHKPALTFDGWDDYLAAGVSLASTGPSSPTLTTFRDGIMTVAFTGTGAQVNEAFGEIHILHDFSPGTTIHPHIHWTHNVAAPTGDVRWLFEYTFQKGHAQGVFPATTTIVVTETAGAQYTHHITEDLTGFSSANLEPDTVLLFRIAREPDNVADTFTGDAFLLFTDLHVQVNNRYTHEKINPFTQI